MFGGKSTLNLEKNIARGTADRKTDQEADHIGLCLIRLKFSRNHQLRGLVVNSGASLRSLICSEVSRLRSTRRGKSPDVGLKPKGSDHVT